MVSVLTETIISPSSWRPSLMLCCESMKGQALVWANWSHLVAGVWWCWRRDGIYGGRRPLQRRAGLQWLDRCWLAVSRWRNSLSSWAKRWSWEWTRCSVKPARFSVPQRARTAVRTDAHRSPLAAHSPCVGDQWTHSRAAEQSLWREWDGAPLGFCSSPAMSYCHLPPRDPCSYIYWTG